MLGAPSGEIKIMDRLQEIAYLGKETFVPRVLDESDVVPDIFRSRRANERGGNVRVRAGILDRELDYIDALCGAILDSSSTTINDCVAGWVPRGRSPAR